MAPFVEILLRAAPASGRVVAPGAQRLDHSRDRRGSVVAGEDDQRIFRRAALLERLKHLSDSCVGFRDELGVRPQAGAPREGGARQHRRVRRTEREIEEKRGLGGTTIAHVSHGARRQVFQHTLGAERRARPAGAVKRRRRRHAGNRGGGKLEHAVAVDVHVVARVERRCQAEVVGESVMRSGRPQCGRRNRSSRGAPSRCWSRDRASRQARQPSAARGAICRCPRCDTPHRAAATRPSCGSAR